MDNSNGPAQERNVVEQREQNIVTSSILASLDADVNRSQSFSIPLRSTSPRGENEDRKLHSPDLFLSAKGPRCSHDLHTGPTIEYKSGLDTFVFPTPSPRLPTPSPRLPSCSTTPQLLPSDRRRESPRIGLAIGSPSDAPPSWGISQTPDCISSRTGQRPLEDGLLTVTEEQAKFETLKKEQRAKKPSSWRWFSNLFKISTKSVPGMRNPTSNIPIYEENLDSPLEPPICSPNVSLNTAAAMLPLSATLPAARPGSSRKYHTRTLSDSRAQPRCESRNSVRISFTRLMRSSCERTTPLSSPWRSNFFRGEHVQSGIPTLHPRPATISRTPRLELNLPEPEMERYSVMFSHLLAPTSTNDSKPSLLERRLSRIPVVNQGPHNITTVESESDASPSRQHSQLPTQLRRSLSIKVDSRRNTSAAPAMAANRPLPIIRSHTAPMYETCQQLASSPESNAGSASHSDTSLPATPTTPNNCISTAAMYLKEDREPTWKALIAQPMIVYPSDVMSSRVDHSIDLEQQLVQVSVARQVSINRARSRVRRTVSMRRPNMVELATAKNRKSEVGILDSVDTAEEEMPGA